MAAANSMDQVMTLSFALISWLFTWSWQALLLLSATWLALELGRSNSAATHYRVWLIATLATAALPLLTALRQTVRLPAATYISWPAVYMRDFPPTALEAVQPVLSPPSLLWPILAAFWAAGVGVSLLKWGNTLRRLHDTRIHSHAVSLADLDCARVWLIRAMAL